MKFVVCMLAAALVLSGCSKKSGEVETAAKTATTEPAPDQHTAQAGGHAPASVVPGSYEDWCDEHQVPETQCTRCNPELVAAFKATNDWCDEHGLPESQCLACNPDLKIVRPAKPVESTEPKTEG